MRRQLQNLLIYSLPPKRPFRWNILKNENKKFHRALLFPKNPKVQKKKAKKKNKEKLCNFGNFVLDNAVNSRFALLYIGKPFATYTGENFWCHQSTNRQALTSWVEIAGLIFGHCCCSLPSLPNPLSLFPNSFFSVFFTLLPPTHHL